MPSKETDTKVVQMQFDNQQFESGVKQTIKSLDDLKKQLNFDEATKSLNNLNQNVNKIDFSTLNKALEATQRRFSIWGQMGEAAINRVVNNVMAKTEQLTKSLTVDQVSEGWRKYESVLTSTRTIMSATGATADDVAKQLKMLMTFADETSYSYADMADSMGKFAAKGFGGTSGKEAVEVARQVSEGIAIWAAQAGQNAQTAARATYQMSQISGWMKLQDWRSIVNANMATKQFMELSMAIAQTDGTLKKVGKTFVTTGKAAKEGLEVNIENFQDTLTNGGWLTTDVFTKTMQAYNSFFDATQKVVQAGLAKNTTEAMDMIKKGGKQINALVGDWSDDYHKQLMKAFEAGQISKTFSDSIDATKDAVSSAFTDIFNVIFGDVNQAATLFTDVTDVLYENIVEPFKDVQEAFNEFNQNEKNLVDIDGEDTKLNKFTAGIYNMMEGIRNSVSLVQDAFSKLIPPVTVTAVTNLSNKFYDLMTRFKNSTVFTKFKSDLDEVTDGATKGSDKVVKAEKAVKDTTEDLHAIVQRVIRGDFANAPDRFNRLAQAGYNWAKVQNGVNEELNCSFRYSQEAIDQAEKQIPGYQDKAKRAADANKEIGDSAEEASKKTKKGVEAMSLAVIDAMSNADKVHVILGGIADAIGIIVDVGKEVITNVIKPITSYAIPKILRVVLDGLAKVADLVSTLRANLRINGTLDKIFTPIKNGILTAEKYIDTFFATVKKNDAFKAFLSNLQTLGQNVKSVFGTALGTVGDFFKGIGKGISGALGGANVTGAMDKVVSGIFGALNKVFNALKPVGNIIKSFFEGIRNSVKGIDWKPIVNGLTQFAGAVGKLIGSGIDKATKLITDFWKAYQGTHGGKNPFQQAAYNISSFLQGAPFKAISKIFSMFTKGNIGAGLSKAFGWLNPAKLKATITIFGDFTKSMFGVDKAAQKVSKGVGGVNKALSPFTAFMNNSFKPVVTWLKPVGDTLGKVGESIKTFFTNINWATVVDVAKVTSVLILASKIGKTIDSFKRIADSFSGIGNSITGFFNQLTNNTIKRTNAKIFKDVATGIAILAGSLFLLCQVDPNRLTRAAIAIGVLAAEIGIISGVLSKLNNVTDVTSGTGKSSGKSSVLGGLASGIGVFAFASAIMMIVSALQPLADMDPGQFAKAAFMVGAIGVVLIALLNANQAIQKKLGSGDGLVSKAQFAEIIANAVSLWIFADSISKVVDAMIKISQSYSLISNIGPTLIGVLGTMTLLAAVAAASSLIKPGNAIGVLALVFAIRKWLDTLQYIANYDMDSINKNLGKIKAVIGQLVIVVGLFGVVSRIAGGSKSMASVAAVVLSIGVTIELIAHAMKKISKLSDSEVTRATIAINSIILFLGIAGGMILAANKSNLTDANMKYLAKTFVGMGAAVVLCAVAIKTISDIPGNQIFAATAAIDSIIWFLGRAASMAKPSKEAAAAFVAMGITMVAMAVVVKMLSDMIDEYGLVTAGIAVGMLDSIILALGKTFAAAGAIQTKSAAVAIAGMAVIMLEMAELLWQINNLQDPENASKVLLALDGMLLSMAVLTQTAANIGDLGSFTGILKGLAKIFMVGGIVSVLTTGIAAIVQKFAGDEGFASMIHAVENLGDLFKAIGDAYGKFVGGFAGGMVSGAVGSIDLSNLENIAKQVSNFMDAVSKIDKSKMSGLKDFSKMTGDISDAVDSLSALSLKAMGFKENANLNKNLSEYAEALLNFGEKADGLDKYQASFTAAKTASKALQDLSEVVKPGFTDVLVAAFTGQSSWSSIGDGLGDFGAGMLKFGKAMLPFQSDPALVQAMDYGVDVGKKVAELKDNVPTTGGLKGIFAGDGSWSSIGDGLSEFGYAMYDFGVAVGGLDAYGKDISYAVETLAPMLIDLKTAIPDTGIKGWFESVFGGKGSGGSWASIGDGLAGFGTAMKEFGKNLDGIGDYTDEIDAVGPLMQKITNMCYSMQDGFDITNFVTMTNNLPKLGTNLAEFATNLGNFTLGGDSPVFSALDRLKTVANTQGDMNVLAEGISKVSKALSEFVSSANGFTLDTTSGVFGALNQLKAYAGTFIADGSIDQFTTLGKNIISHLADGLKDDSGSIKAAIQATVTAAASAISGSGDVNSKFKAVGEKLMASLANGIKSGKSKSAVKGAIDATINSATSGLNLSNKLYDDGASLMAGLANGIRDNLWRVTSQMAAVANQTNKTFTIHTEVNSPSRLYARYGNYLMEGLANGISANSYKAANSMATAAYAVNGSAYDNLDTNLASGLSFTADSINNFGMESYRLASNISGMESAIRMNQMNAADQSANNQNGNNIPNEEYTINVPLSIDGRQVAKATAVYNRQELNRIDKVANRKRGIRQ